MTVRFGIIGPGSIATRFATVLNTVDGVQLTAVASRDQAKAAAFAGKFGAAKAYGSYLELIQDSAVDVIYIGLTHNFHYEVAKLCLNHGKSVLCEKPLVTSQKDAAELAELAREKKVLLMEAMWTRCIPAFRKAREWVAGGRIGAVKLIDASFSFNAPFDPEHRLYDPKLAGGSLYDAGVYPIEFATGILAENPSAVKGVATVASTGVDDNVAMVMSFASGALAMLSCGLTANTTRNASIYGTDGHIVVYNFLGPRQCELYDNQNKLVESFEEDFSDGFIYQIRHFADLYRNHKVESDLIPLQDTVACAAIFDDLMQQWGLK